MLQQLNDAFNRLSSRDRNLLVLMGVCVGLFIVFVTGLQISRAIGKRGDRIEVKTQELREVGQLTQGYNQAEAAQRELERKLPDHAVKNLFSYLEDLGKKDGLEIGGMSDKGTQPVGDGKTGKIVQQSVEVTLTHVALDKLTKFLNDVEANPGMVRVTRLQLRPRADDDVLDAWFTVATYYTAS